MSVVPVTRSLEGDSSSFEERLALEALYNATGGESFWYESCRCNSQGCWLQPDFPYCNWTGVGCSTNFTVNTLNLANCNLSGELPFDLLARLPGLTGLDCSNNSLTGAIPRLSPSLAYLYLQYNQLTGSFPTLEFVSSLNVIFLSFNKLVGRLPEGLSRWMPQLDALLLGNNRFEGKIPGDLCESCSMVDLSWNSFTGSFPITICTSSNSQLVKLYLSSNSLSGELPAAISRCTSLQVLALSNNSLTGSLPSELQLLNNLTYLSLSGNGFDNSFDNLINDVNGVLPSGLCFCDVSYNNLTGSIDSLWDATPSLSYLSVAGNQEMKATSLNPYPQMVKGGRDIYEGEYRCESFRVVALPLELVISPSYFNYTHCECAQGYFGKPPRCKDCQSFFPYASSCANDSMTYSKNYYPELCSTSTKKDPTFVPCATALNGDFLCNVDGSCRILSQSDGTYVWDQKDCEACRQGYVDRLCSRCLCNNNTGGKCYFEHLNECVECQEPPSWVIALVGILIGCSFLMFLLPSRSHSLRVVALFQGIIALTLLALTLVWDLSLVLVLLFLQLLVLWNNGGGGHKSSVLKPSLITTTTTTENSWYPAKFDLECSFEGLAKILLFFLQTAHLVIKRWPLLLSRVPYVLDFVNLSIDLRCYPLFRPYFVSEWKAFLIGMMVPPLLCLLYSFLVLVQTLGRVLFSKYCEGSKKESTTDEFPGRTSEDTPTLVVQDEEEEEIISTTTPIITYESMERYDDTNPPPLQREKNSTISHWKWNLWYDLIHGLLLVMYVAYPLLVKKILSVFSCHSSACETSYMDSKPWLPCNRSDSNYGPLWLEAIIFLNIYLVGLLVMFSGLLIWRRNTLELPSTQRWLGLLYLSYRPRFYWYELVWLLRKLCISAALATLSDERMQMFVIILVLLLCIAAQSQLQPFRHPLENKLEMCSLGLLVLMTVARDSGDLAWFSACGTIACALILGCFVFVKMMPCSPTSSCVWYHSGC